MDLSEKYLSFVVTSRNDGGEAELRRIQLFVDTLLEQSRRYHLDAELILVEWNPPSNHPPLAQALKQSYPSGSCPVRVIQVPPEIHRRFENSEIIPLFQMIAKNVGIRRARGRFILATNVDILFSDQLINFFASRKLQENLMYRIDRHDIPADIPMNLSIDQQMDWCRRNVLREYHRSRTVDINNEVRSLKKKNIQSFIKKSIEGFIRKSRQGLITVVKNLIWYVKRDFNKLMTAGIKYWIRWRIWKSSESFIKRVRQLIWHIERSLRFLPWPTKLALPWRTKLFLHTNACGDFTLLSKYYWEMVMAYPEFPVRAMKLDGLLCYAAHYAGAREYILKNPMRIYHLEHLARADGASIALSKRSTDTQSIQISYEQYEAWVEQMDQMRCPMIFNGEDWGLANDDLPEIVLN